MSARDEIAALKKAVGVKTASALAERLGIRHVAISHWIKRDAVPEKYKALIRLDSYEAVQTANEMVGLLRVFGDLETSVWLEVALGAIPPELLGDQTSDDLKRARRQRRLIVRVMDLARVTVQELIGKDACDNDQDVRLMIEALKRNYGRMITNFAELQN